MGCISGRLPDDPGGFTCMLYTAINGKQNHIICYTTTYKTSYFDNIYTLCADVPIELPCFTKNKTNQIHHLMYKEETASTLPKAKHKS